MVKQHRKSSNRSNKSKTLKKYSKSKTNHKASFKNMRGGDDGRYVLPPAYFGEVPNGYYEAGSPELVGAGNQVSVSQGTVWEGGKYAGPNLYPMQGGGCGCSGKRNQKSKSNNYKSKSKHKSKSKSNNSRISKSRQH